MANDPHRSLGSPGLVAQPARELPNQPAAGDLETGGPMPDHAERLARTPKLPEKRELGRIGVRAPRDPGVCPAGAGTERGGKRGMGSGPESRQWPETKPVHA